MTKYIKYHKNYTEFGEPYQLVLPLNLEGLVPDDDSVEDQRFFNISDTFFFQHIPLREIPSASHSIPRK